MLSNEIIRLKKEKKAVILAHHYQCMEVKAIADFVGDSLELSKIAANLECDRIVLCGVKFMAETAKILAPNKIVLLPNLEAGCPMADMVTSEDVLMLKEKYPNAQVVTYVNSSAEVKAVSDICCTSSNASKIVQSMESNEIIFVPDQNLAQFTQLTSKDKTIHLWRGFCPTHHIITREMVEKRRAEFPNAVLYSHPECKPEVLELSDYVGSTAQIIERCKKSEAKEIIIGTENGVVDSLRELLPEKVIIPLNEHMICPNMKKTTLDDVYRVLQDDSNEIILEDHISELAKKAIFNMIERS